MDAKDKLRNILEENKKLKEELKMAKTKLKENEAGKDTQVAPPQAVAKSDGSALNPKDASQDDLAKKYEENEADKDVQATPAQPVTASDGDSAMKTDSKQASQDDLVKKYAAKKMEQSPEGEEKEVPATEVKKDEALPDNTEQKPDVDLAEKYKEMEGDMGKVVEIMEAMRNEIDTLKKDIETLKGGDSEKGAEEEKPEPPMTEKANLRDVFVESIQVGNKTDDFAKIVKNVIY